MKIGASLVLLVAPTVIACAAAVPVGVGRAHKNAHTTNPNGVFRKRASPLRSNARNFMNIRMREQLRPRADRRKFRACSFDGKVRRQASRKGLRTPPSGSSAKMA